MKTTNITTKTTNKMIKEYNKALMNIKEANLKASMIITKDKINEMKAQYQEFYKDYILAEDK
jgi:hypothetical protein